MKHKHSVIKTAALILAMILAFVAAVACTGPVGPKGDKGDTGERGETGVPGEDGLVPHVGENGNWWIGDKDTGIAAKGLPGETGIPGESGVPGETGAAGETGADGKDGIVPQLRVDKNGYWEASYDKGKTWNSLGVRAYTEVYINEDGYWVIDGVVTDFKAASAQTTRPAPSTPRPTQTTAPVVTPPEPTEPSVHISKDAELSFSLELVGTYNVGGGYTVGQGSCTDGKYGYLIFENQSLSPHMGKIVKIDLETFSVLKVSDPLAIDHGNDITYNSKTKELIVSHNSPNRTKLSRIDPESLTVTETFTIEHEVYGITYNEAIDKYCLGISYCFDFAIYDASFKAETRWTGKTGNTKQGLDSDRKYIYYSQWQPNLVYVYDWDGNYINTINIPKQDLELEAIFHIDDVFYVTFIKSGKTLLYRAEIVSTPAA